MKLRFDLIQYRLVFRQLGAVGSKPEESEVGPLEPVAPLARNLYLMIVQYD